MEVDIEVRSAFFFSFRFSIPRRECAHNLALFKQHHHAVTKSLNQIIETVHY
jgi:hypothetical protein